VSKADLCFTAYGDPKPLARHQTRVVKVKGKPAWAQQFDPKKNVDNKAYVRQAAAIAMRDAGLGTLFDGPLDVTLEFWQLQPKSKRVANPGRVKPENLPARMFPVGKPDLDNLVKLVLDACNEVVWADDKTICAMTVQKFYTLDRPRTVVKVRRMALEEWVGAGGERGEK